MTEFSGMKISKKGKKLIITAALAFVILVLAIVAIVLGVRNKRIKDQIAQQDESLAALLSEEGSKREILEMPEEKEPVLGGEAEVQKVHDGNFQVTMTTEWNYPDINTPADDSYVENAVNNTLDTRFKVVLAEDEDYVLYESPLLPVGSYTERIPVKAELSPGEHNCVVIYDLFVPGTDESAGTVRVGLTININS